MVIFQLPGRKEKREEGGEGKEEEGIGGETRRREGGKGKDSFMSLHSNRDKKRTEIGLGVWRSGRELA